jgi:PleD family two-component response regulator
MVMTEGFCWTLRGHRTLLAEQSMSISVGLAVLAGDETLDEIVERADHALVRANASRVVLAQVQH